MPLINNGKGGVPLSRLCSSLLYTSDIVMVRHGLVVCTAGIPKYLSARMVNYAMR